LQLRGDELKHDGADIFEESKNYTTEALSKAIDITILAQISAYNLIFSMWILEN
jgi:hypothetical protein